MPLPPGMMPPQIPPMGMPMGMTPPGPDPAIAALEGLNGVPSPAREEKALADAAAQIQIALTTASLRSPKAAKHLANAYKEIQTAREALKELAQQPVGPPPDLLGGLASLSQGSPTPLL